MTIVEVLFASGILTMVLLGVLQGMLQSRRLTEGSVRQISVASIVQGYLEQIKSLKYATTSNALPSSPDLTPGIGDLAAWQAYTGSPDANPVIPVKDSDQADQFICLCTSTTAPTSLPDISTLPTNASRHTESVDIDNSLTGADNCTLNMWVWITPLTGTNVVSCKSIVIVYQWSIKNGGRITYRSDMVRTIRSIVPTD